MSADHQHCSVCINLKCTGKSCPVVSCKNLCSFMLHECKLDEHLSETCPNEYVDCINKCNGCKLLIKRKDLGNHLKCCIASVIKCGSYRVRRIISKDEKLNRLKWPCPVDTEFKDLANLKESGPYKTNMNEILLKQDYASVKRSAKENPLRFSRLYGYLIGLDVGKDFSDGRFSFLSRLLKNVKSSIFKDIQSENCIIFNTEEGCLACRARIKTYEQDRFYEMKKEHFDESYAVLYNISTYEQFVEEKIYLKPEFLKAYDKIYSKPKKVRPDFEPEYDDLDEKEIDLKLIENNEEILKIIELNPTLRLNLSKEIPCDAFYDYSDAYRLKETTFTVECEQILRRDEYSDHYKLFHDYLLPNADYIDLRCPMYQYGCRYFEQKSEFFFGKNEECKYLNLKHPRADLVDKSLTGNLGFQLEYLNIKKIDQNASINLMDLPFDVIVEIIERLDSLSLYCFSITSKSARVLCEKFVQHRGIVYPKWSRKKNLIPVNMTEEFDQDYFRRYKWEIDKYVYSFSKHVENPTTISLKKSSEYNFHIQNCKYKRIKNLTEKFLVYPSMNTPAS